MGECTTVSIYGDTIYNMARLVGCYQYDQNGVPEIVCNGTYRSACGPVPQGASSDLSFIDRYDIAVTSNEFQSVFKQLKDLGWENLRLVEEKRNGILIGKLVKADCCGTINNSYLADLHICDGIETPRKVPSCNKNVPPTTTKDPNIIGSYCDENNQCAESSEGDWEINWNINNQIGAWINNRCQPPFTDCLCVGKPEKDTSGELVKHDTYKCIEENCISSEECPNGFVGDRKGDTSNKRIKKQCTANSVPVYDACGKTTEAYTCTTNYYCISTIPGGGIWTTEITKPFYNSSLEKIEANPSSGPYSGQAWGTLKTSICKQLETITRKCFANNPNVSFPGYISAKRCSDCTNSCSSHSEINVIKMKNGWISSLYKVVIKPCNTIAANGKKVYSEYDPTTSLFGLINVDSIRLVEYEGAKKGDIFSGGRPIPNLS